jgi:hypothetical protein
MGFNRAAVAKSNVWSSLPAHNISTVSTVSNDKYFTFESFTKEVDDGQVRQPFDVPSMLYSTRWNEQSVFLEAIDKHSIVIECSQFTNLNFKEKSFPSLSSRSVS